MAAGAAQVKLGQAGRVRQETAKHDRNVLTEECAELPAGRVSCSFCWALQLSYPTMSVKSAGATALSIAVTASYVTTVRSITHAYLGHRTEQNRAAAVPCDWQLQAP